MNKAISLQLVFLIGVTGIGIFDCNPKTTIKSAPDKTAQTDECAFKDEICKEALDFQKEYDRMPEEERKDMVSVLNTYIMHCEEAKKMCEKSNK